MIPNKDVTTWTPEEEQEFDLFQRNVYDVLHGLLACCFVRNSSRSDEINSAVDVILLGWLFSTYSIHSPTDIDYVSNLTSHYSQMKSNHDDSLFSEILEIRETVRTSDYSSLRKMSNTIDFTFASMQKDQCGHSWRDHLSGAALDTISSSITSGIEPKEVEVAMLLLIRAETEFIPVQFGEFVVSRFRSRLDSYKEAIEELKVRLEDG